jgi:hypothetical protein
MKVCTFSGASGGTISRIWQRTLSTRRLRQALSSQLFSTSRVAFRISEVPRAEWIARGDGLSPDSGRDPGPAARHLRCPADTGFSVLTDVEQPPPVPSLSSQKCTSRRKTSTLSDMCSPSRPSMTYAPTNVQTRTSPWNAKRHAAETKRPNRLPQHVPISTSPFGDKALNPSSALTTQSAGPARSGMPTHLSTYTHVRVSEPRYS